MTHGTLALGRCYGTQHSAAQAYCSAWQSQLGSGGISGSQCVAKTVFTSLPSSSIGGFHQLTYQVGAVVYSAPLFACDIPDFVPGGPTLSDTHSIWIAVISVLLSALAYRLVRSSLN